MTSPIGGGITAAAGFRAAAVSCGLKADALDLALIVADETASAAAVFTTNLVVAAPVLVAKRHLTESGGTARAVVVNSGCANACTGAEGMVAADAMATAVAQAIGCRTEHVLIASTGVIGLHLDSTKIARGVADAAIRLGRDTHTAAAEAIMTTDIAPKEAAVRVDTPAGSFAIGGMVKGAGMIEPNMATMLGFLTTDAAVGPDRLRRALSEAVDDTFNAITVDGECSTNDAVFLLASGASGVTIDEAAHAAFVDALREVCGTLAREIVRGGEGATKLVAVRVTSGGSDADARRAARAIANSLLVKTALNGGDPNWGRLLAVAGRAGVAVEPARAQVRIGPAVLFADDTVFADREPAAAAHLAGDEVEVQVDLGTDGGHAATVWTCDLSAQYVRINADYRT
ncbi:MAG: bifunctional glutamate N-acetyltransferase/amino-acid acetyltransferase ArgJ [Acidobacteria bacterium]|nr:bifunctional glutamate N-acetyltransferase/amino-acid acetyltransferase ArgJ [Acidobacteriota bacterium]